jgi:2-methylcitrate dehydratase PrpD
MDSTTSPRHADELIEFASTLAHGTLPDRVLRNARRALLDNIGCGLFGASQPWSRIMAAEVLADNAPGECGMFGEARGVSAAGAALVNGTAIHGFELDDLIPSAIVHPGTVVVPAVLAAAESCNASGASLLAALVAGYEATARISIALGTAPSERGFHKTGLVGPVAAAIAVGRVMRLDVEEMRSAVGLACSMSSGIKAYAGGGGGGMVKRMHAGRAAEAGVRAARLAARGFTGPANALDGHLGLLEVFGADAARPAMLAYRLDDAWYIDDVWVKAYPICGWIQGVAQLLLGLRGPAALTTRDIARIRIGTSAFAVKHNGNDAPRDEMEAQYSIPYCAALALCADPADPRAFSADAIGDPSWRALARRVELHVDAECEAVYPTRFGSRIDLELTSGETRSAFTLDPHGTAADPMTDEELERKFLRLAAYAPCPVNARGITRFVAAIDAAPNIRQLSGYIRGLDLA